MTAIEWTDATWNPVTGCDRVSPGCGHCYALTMAGRLKGMGQPRYQRDGDPRTSGPGFGVTCHEDALVAPLAWRKPRRVFVNSMSDLFHPAVPDEFIGGVFDVMARCPQHTFQILTKRPLRMERLLSIWYTAGSPVQLPLPNVWLGVSIESDHYTWRADRLRATPAAVRFISAEPLLGPLPSLDLTGIDWLIVGGESGPGARPMHPDWVRDLRDRCYPSSLLWHDHPSEESDSRCEACADLMATRPAFFFKQWGEWLADDGRNGSATAIAEVHHWLGLEDRPVVVRRLGKKAAGRLLDGRTWDEYPDELRRAEHRALIEQEGQA